MTEATDEELLERVRRGDPGGASELFARYSRPIFRFTARMTRSDAEAEEVTQEVFLKMIERVEQYDGRARVASWLFAIAANACRDRFRQSRRGAVVPLEAVAERADGEEGADERLLSAERRTLVRRALGSLSEEQRAALVLARYHGLPYAEIARVLSISEGAVKTRIFRAMETLKRVFAEGETPCRAASVDLPDRVLARLSGSFSPEEEAGLWRHLAGCADCRAEAEELESVWNRLGKDPEPVPARGFARRTLEALEEATLARRVVRFPRRGAWAVLAQAAVVVLAAAAGWVAARHGARAPEAPFQATPAPAVALVPVSSERTLDAASAIPDLSGRPTLANVSFRPADESGKVGVSFDVTTRYTVLGRPGDDGLSRLLPYLLAGAATEGTRGRALDLVSSSMASGNATSPEVVSALVTTLRTDRNPGVRRKAAEALGQLPPSPQIRQALVETLKAEPNPGIRIVAVEALARAARELRDPAAIETLRERAADGRENGYVRVQAASALAGLTM